jgi:hypothetical protein
MQMDLGSLPHSIGDVYQPNAAETLSVHLFLSRNPPPPRSILVLPASAQRMRRYLNLLCQLAPHAARNLVVVNGDDINFNNVYRDRDFAWNALDLPVPLVFFAHRNPVDREAGVAWPFDWQRREEEGKKRTTTGTHDMLLFRDIVEAMLYAAFEDGHLLGDAERVRDRLRHSTWRGAPVDRVQNALVPRAGSPSGTPLFHHDGDRRSGTGEHIVCLRPNFLAPDDRLDAQRPCTISIYRLDPVATPAWRLLERKSPPYNGQPWPPDE